MTIQLEKYHAISGMNRIENEVSAELYYFTNDMLQNNILIECATTHKGEHEVEEIICLCHIEKDNATIYTVYEGSYLQEIEIYRTLKDLNDLFLNHSLEDFLIIMKQLSTSSISSSDQSEEHNRLEVASHAKYGLEHVRQHLK